MRNIFSSALVISAAAMALAGGCASGPDSGYSSQPPSESRNYSRGTGTVDHIEVVNKSDSNNRNIAGTVIGGIVGGLIGHQIGSGSGQTAATVAGAVGGAVAGSAIEKRSRRANETFRVSVRMDDGSYQTVTQDDISDLRAGDRVQIENGRLFRS